MICDDKMTEKQVFQFLLKEENNAKTFHYPKLQKEAVVIISRNLSNIIYDSLKQKSSASNIKRRNVLKFLNTICELKEQHSFFGNDWIDKYLLGIRKSFENVELCNLLDSCSDELENSISNNFLEKVIKHHEVKNMKRRKNIKYVEFIKEKDQIKMDCKYDIHVKKFSHYERNENIIKSLITYQPEKSFMKHSFFSQSEYREKQIKLAYALLNMNSREDDILEGILFRLASYKTLESFEQTFLQNLFGKSGTKVTAFMDRFFFLLERVILEYATNLLTKENELDVCQYFVDLESDDTFLIIREICRKDNTLYLRMKTCIYELYCTSYCNENILKLCELIL